MPIIIGGVTITTLYVKVGNTTSTITSVLDNNGTQLLTTAKTSAPSIWYDTYISGTNHYLIWYIQNTDSSQVTLYVDTGSGYVNKGTVASGTTISITITSKFGGGDYGCSAYAIASGKTQSNTTTAAATMA